MTVTEAQGAGFVTVYPCGAIVPTPSSLNFVAGSTVPNNVIAKIGAAGKVCLFVSNGTHLLADVAGYFAAGPGFFVDGAGTVARHSDGRHARSTAKARPQACRPRVATEVQVTVVPGCRTARPRQS